MADWYRRLSLLIADRAGLQLPKGVRPSVERFLITRCHVTDKDSVSSYLDALEKDDDPLERQRLLNLVTNGLTHFFREPLQLAGVRQLMAAFPHRDKRPMAIWCCGCSTGDEAYTLAMLAAEANLAVEVLATDLNTESLEIATQGQYNAWSVRNVPAEELERHFHQTGDVYSVLPHIRQQVTFRRQNLMITPYPRPVAASSWDLILCRNVLLYFSPRDQRRIHLRFAQVIDPGGHLFLGVSESVRDDPFSLTTVGQAFCFRIAPSRRADMVTSSWDETSLDSASLDTTTSLDGASLDPTDYDGRPGSTTLGAECTNRALDRILKAVSRSDKDSELLLQRYVNEYPQDVTALVTMGNVLLAEQRYAEALERYAEAEEVDWFDPEIHFAAGMAYRQIGDIDRAMRAFRRTLFLDGRNWLASFQLASLLRQTGKIADSRREFQSTLDRVTGRRVAPIEFKAYFAGMDDAAAYRQSVEMACNRELERLR